MVVSVAALGGAVGVPEVRHAEVVCKAMCTVGPGLTVCPISLNEWWSFHFCGAGELAAHFLPLASQHSLCNLQGYPVMVMGVGYPSAFTLRTGIRPLQYIPVGRVVAAAKAAVNRQHSRHTSCTWCRCVEGAGQWYSAEAGCLSHRPLHVEI
jgi:hypothetical protein